MDEWSDGKIERKLYSYSYQKVIITNDHDLGSKTEKATQIIIMG